MSKVFICDIMHVRRDVNIRVGRLHAFELIKPFPSTRANAGKLMRLNLHINRECLHHRGVV